MFSVKDAEICTEIYVHKLSDVGNDNESENCDEKSDNTINGSEIVAPRKESDEIFGKVGNDSSDYVPFEDSSEDSND
uniref:Uncharacterized protein n=1 Tax=Vespula pensylvanica TaxID=30213 RepID=A0A834N7G3_VESPE|nr:hypothetical protein H0235_016710 [Vespula pensylvanica]